MCRPDELSMSDFDVASEYLYEARYKDTDKILEQNESYFYCFVEHVKLSADRKIILRFHLEADSPSDQRQVVIVANQRLLQGITHSPSSDKPAFEIVETSSAFFASDETHFKFQLGRALVLNSSTFTIKSEDETEKLVNVSTYQTLTSFGNDFE